MNWNEIRFGVEVEMERISRARAALTVATVIGGHVSRITGTEAIDAAGRRWRVVRDGSLAAGGAELVTPILTWDDMTTLQQIVRALRAAGARISSRCGLHVHIDAGGFDGKALKNLAKIVYRQEDLIVQALGISPNRLGSYTKKIDPDFIDRIVREAPRTVDDLQTAWYGAHRVGLRNSRHTTRYHGLNLHAVADKGTVEFRWFEGTLHAGKIKAYVQLCLTLGAKAANAKGARWEKREQNGRSDKYDFRCFLLRLGMIGKGFKTARLHLLALMAGSAAWKNGRPAGR